MKKLKLSLIQEAGEILTPKELKKIIGGGPVYGSGTCGAFLPLVDKDGGPYMGSLPSGSSIHVDYFSVDEKAGTTIYRGISKEGALALTQGISGAKWCCDNCDKASWY